MHRNVLVPLHWKPAALPDPECFSWMSQLLTEDFFQPCLSDRVCNTCGGAGFCGHCCGEHHRGHDTAAVVAAEIKVHKRDSFCIACRVAFCSDVCAHHHAVSGGTESHEVIPIVNYKDQYCARCTGSERWFLAACGSVRVGDSIDNVLFYS